MQNAQDGDVELIQIRRPNFRQLALFHDLRIVNSASALNSGTSPSVKTNLGPFVHLVSQNFMVTTCNDPFAGGGKKGIFNRLFGDVCQIGGDSGVGPGPSILY
jgi:hypothetical protein